MGKIRVRTLGVDEIEKKQKLEARKKSEGKKLVKGGKDGERIVAVGPTEEELAKLSASENLSDSVVARETSNKKTATAETQKAKKHRIKEKIRSKNYQISAKLVDRTKKYSLDEAISLLEKLKRSKFDETVELHINTIETGLSGNAVLPYGTGKVFRVAIANDEILAEVQKGNVNFDMLLATPDMMPKLARVAKFLGPRGLMPNPKNGTLTKDPEKAAASFKKGQVNFKTEAKSPIMHLSVGKMSFGAKKLSENIKTILEAVKKEKIRNVTLKSTMSPGIKLSL